MGFNFLCETKQKPAIKPTTPPRKGKKVKKKKNVLLSYKFCQRGSISTFEKVLGDQNYIQVPVIKFFFDVTILNAGDDRTHGPARQHWVISSHLVGKFLLRSAFHLAISSGVSPCGILLYRPDRCWCMMCFSAHKTTLRTNSGTGTSNKTKKRATQKKAFKNFLQKELQYDFYSNNTECLICYEVLYRRLNYTSQSQGFGAGLF